MCTRSEVRGPLWECAEHCRRVAVDSTSATDCAASAAAVVNGAKPRREAAARFRVRFSRGRSHGTALLPSQHSSCTRFHSLLPQPAVAHTLTRRVPSGVSACVCRETARQSGSKQLNLDDHNRTSEEGRNLGWRWQMARAVLRTQRGYARSDGAGPPADEGTCVKP